MRKHLRLAAGCLAVLAACNEAPFSTPESGAGTSGPALSAGESGRSTVVVNPEASGNGVAATIQEGIDMVAPGGRVMITPGTYPEALFIEKGVTLEPIGEGAGDVVLAPPPGTFLAIYIVATEPVVIRGLSIDYPGAGGIRSDGPVDVWLDRVTVRSATPATNGHAVFFLNDPFFTPYAGGRGKALVTGSHIDGGVPTEALPHAQNFGLRAFGDVDARFEGNTVRHVGGSCIIVTPRNDMTGTTNVDIIGNDLDECYPAQRVAAIVIGVTSAASPFTLAGTVNVVGNTIRNTAATCLITSAIVYQNFTGRIEHNTIEGFVQGCATATARNGPSAISLGSRSGIPGNLPSVRFNDIGGNAFAGLRLESNVTASVDARCNWWGTADGPSGAGAGSGSALVVDGAAPVPTYLPFATAPIAGTGATGC